LLALHIWWCYSSRTSRSWWITHSTQYHRRGCNTSLSVCGIVAVAKVQPLFETILNMSHVGTSTGQQYYPAFNVSRKFVSKLHAVPVENDRSSIELWVGWNYKKLVDLTVLRGLTNAALRWYCWSQLLSVLFKLNATQLLLFTCLCLLHTSAAVSDLANRIGCGDQTYFLFKQFRWYIPVHEESHKHRLAL